MDHDVAVARDIPLNLYKNTAPLEVVVLENRRMTPEDSPNDVRHVVLKYAPGSYRFLEGQSAGIPPPGLNARGRPNVPRLYSIASQCAGEDGTATTLALTVKRVVYTDDDGVERLGLSSNHLCDARPGDVLKMTGPAGKDFLLPDEPGAPMLMIATGTGIAPFRAFVHAWAQRPRGQRGFAWLVFGAQTSGDLLYAEEWSRLAANPDFRVDYAISREQKKSDGGRMYVQDRMRAIGQPLWELVSAPETAVYICGIKGMEVGIEAVLGEMAAAAGQDWGQIREQKREAERWHVEVY
jgi:ferredoxin--NADP+ reductase